MTELWVDIERLVLDGISLDAAKGQQLAALTHAALERLLRQRGISAVFRDRDVGPVRGGDLNTSAADEAGWANELAHGIFRAIDRST